MTRYRYYTASTLDGYLADENHSLNWLFSLDIDENGPGNTAAFLTEVGAQVMGSSTYQWVLENEPGWLPEMPTFVFTRRDLKAANEHVSFLAGSPADHRDALEAAAGGRDVWVMGGGGLAAEFARAGMLDEMVVSIAPVTLGSGKQLLEGAFDLQLKSCEQNRDFVVVHYALRGPLTNP